ncbi:protein rep [Pseudonocardia sp. ICBG601]|uniref:protein rep n=1 Tax=Pseudonocardia sp. ICBG601 TaxID=2846759 RepID=UPI001CF6C020|nr:protein rep [Pseudonocardia sp. ICBG601]
MPALGNDAISDSAAGQSHGDDLARTFWERQDQALREKYVARRKLAEITTLPRVARCGRVSINTGGEVSLHHTPGSGEEPGSAGFGGLVTCGSVWDCPVCSAKISAKRAKELQHLINWNAERGGTVALLTLTMSHHKGHSLREVRRALTRAWRHLSTSRSWQELKQLLDMDYVRGIDATQAEVNGWHLHIHALLIFPEDVTARVPELVTKVYKLWTAGLAKSGFTASFEHGVDVRVGSGALEKMAKYISKLAFETAGGRWKQGKNGSRTPFQILADALETGDERDIALWQEWEQGSKGMQQLVWSNGLKAKCKLDEIDDETIAEENAGGELAAVLPARTWRKVYPEAEDLLLATRHGGVPAAHAWLDARGLDFEFETDTTERAVQLDDPPERQPFGWLKAALAAEDPEQRRARRRWFTTHRFAEQRFTEQRSGQGPSPDSRSRTVEVGGVAPDTSTGRQAKQGG